MMINRRLQWILVFSISLIAIISRLKFNGLVLNFDYGIYQPDGSHYAYRTLIFLGVESSVAAERVVDWYQANGVKNNNFPPEFLTPENTTTWGLVAPRILYSLISIPFVHLFGISGMMVIPIMSFILLIFCIFRMSELLKRQSIGFLLILVLCSSPTVLRWMIANITDSLLAALFGVVILLLMSNVTNRKWNLGIVFLIVLTSMTRFCLPIWLAIAVVLWVNQTRWRSTTVLITSIIAFLPTYLYMPSNAVLPANSEADFIPKLFLLARSFFAVGFIEVAQLAALDRLLLVTLVVALVVALKQKKEISSKYFLAVTLAAWIIGAINGTFGVNFRYQLPILGFASWVILANSTRFTDWFSGRGVDIVGKKTQD